MRLETKRLLLSLSVACLVALMASPLYGLEVTENFDDATLVIGTWSPLATNCNYSYEAAGGWSGGAAKFTTPTAEGYCGFTSFGTAGSATLNIRYLLKVSSLYSTSGWCDGNKNIIILKTGQNTEHRSIGFHTRRYADKGTINVCVEIECVYADPLFYWELGYADEWVSVEYEFNSSSNIFRVYITTQDGEFNDTVVATTGSGGNYTADSIQILGGYFQSPCASYDANRYFMIDNLRVSTAGHIGPPEGFLGGTPARKLNNVTGVRVTLH